MDVQANSKSHRGTKGKGAGAVEGPPLRFLLSFAKILPLVDRLCGEAEAKDNTQDRGRWRVLVEDLCSIRNKDE